MSDVKEDKVSSKENVYGANIITMICLWYDITGHLLPTLMSINECLAFKCCVA